MRIRAFHIDSFGVLSQVTVEDLPKGLSIFLGNNEAGKSTCLEFFRSTLTGYPLARSKDAKKTWGAGSRQGGSLHLEAGNGTLLRLSRQPGPGGGMPALYDAHGNPLDIAEWDRLLGGVSREVYRSIYGFSLSELQSFESLDSEAVRNVLYGAGFGLGLNAPGAALARLQEGMDEIFKPSGKNPPLNVALRQWDELKRELRGAEEEAARYDSLAAEWNEAAAKLQDIRREKQSLEEERRELERRLSVWKQWEEWRLAKARLDRLDPVAETFPADGPARLDRLLDRRETAERQTSLARERLNRLDATLAALAVDARLAPLLPDIRSLNERKSSCRSALMALPALRANLQRTEDSLVRQLASLGPTWNMERIRAMDRSLFVREELESKSTALQASDGHTLSLTAALDRAVREAAQAAQAAVMARQALASLPEPAAELDRTAREDLHTQIFRMEEARQRLPERQKTLALSRVEYTRALSYLHVRPDAPMDMLHTLAAAQEQALILAEDVKVQAECENATAREVHAARKEEEAAAERLHRVQAQERALSGADRHDLDSRRAALRRLRQSVSLQQQEEVRLADLAERHATQEASFPRPRGNKITLALGMTLSLAGAATLIARLIFGVDHIALTPLWAKLPQGLNLPPELPLIVWGGYLALFVGVLFMTTGRPHAGPDKARAESQLSQLRSRRDTSAARLAELCAEVQSLCNMLDAASCDAADLDALEIRLDREREQCAANERMREERGRLQAELDAKRRQLKAREAEHAAAEQAGRNARLRWHDNFVRLGTLSVPLPEAAHAYFARVESTIITHAATAGIEKEIQELRDRGHELIRQARELLPPENLPAWAKFEPVGPAASYTDDQVDAMLDIARRMLDSCRQADAQAEERARAAEALRAAEAAVTRADDARDEAEKNLRAAHANRAALEDAWGQYLGGMGLNPQLSPATAREALDCMERCLGIESEQARLYEEIALQERERNDLIVPLSAMLQSLDRRPRLGLDSEPDWLGTLDILQRDAEAAQRLEEDKTRQQGQKAEWEEELRAAEAQEADARRAVEDLLALGGAAEPEEFLRLAGVREEKSGLLRRCQDMEDALRLAASDVPLDTFLAEFARTDKNTLDFRHDAVTRRLDALQTDEQSHASDTAALDAKMKELAASQRLADLRREEAALDESIRALSLEWSRFALARQLLLDARRHFEKERQPEVVRMASDIFAAITGGAWTRIAASLEDRSLRAVPPHGDPLPPEVLSRGTQEQLYLAMRLAHIRSHGRRAEPLPVIMDDILVNFDPGRAERTVEALAALTEPAGDSPGHQILFFTCHPGTAEKLRDGTPGSALFSVNEGKVARMG